MMNEAFETGDESERDCRRTKTLFFHTWTLTLMFGLLITVMLVQ